MNDPYVNSMIRPMPGLPYMPMVGFMDVFSDERQSFEDARRLQSFYPETAQEIQRHVEEACDQMEYEGSMMFDEYPDRIMILRMTNEVYDNVRDAVADEAPEDALDEVLEEVDERQTEEDLSMQSARCRNCGPDRPGLKDFIRVMLLDEMHRRRCRHRRCRRFW